MLRWWPWCAAILLLLWQVDFQFTYGFLADTIQKDLDLTAGQATAVSSAFLFAYGLMQLPAGLLIDRFGVRWVLPIAGWAAAGAVLFFARSESFGDLIAARVLAGIFMAFMFPSAGKIARVRLPAARFALAMAIADMCFGVGALTASNMASFLASAGWDHLMMIHSIVGFSLAAIVAVSLTGMPKPTQLAATEADLTLPQLLARKRVLLGAAIYVWGSGITFAFAGYWNLKLQAACQCTAPQVSALSTALFGGLALGMLLSGLIAGTEARRRVVLRVGTASTLVLLALVLYMSPRGDFPMLMPLMVGLGAALGTSALAFAVAVPGVPTHQSGTVVAIVNGAGCFGGALLQEIPIWLGAGDDDLRAMYWVYLAMAVIGVVLTAMLPRPRPV